MVNASFPRKWLAGEVDRLYRDMIDMREIEVVKVLASEFDQGGKSRARQQQQTDAPMDPSSKIKPNMKIGHGTLLARFVQ